MTQLETYDNKAERDERFRKLREAGHKAVFRFSGCRQKNFLEIKGLPNYTGRKLYRARVARDGTPVVNKQGHPVIERHGRERRIYISTWSVAWSD